MQRLVCSQCLSFLEYFDIRLFQLLNGTDFLKYDNPQSKVDIPVITQFEDETERVRSQPKCYVHIDPLLNILIVFVEEGVGYCVQTITKGNTFYTSILNPGDVTGVGHHRFTCLVRHGFISNKLFYKLFKLGSIASKTLFFRCRLSAYQDRRYK